MSENNQSGNRWETKPADETADPVESPDVESPDVEPVEPVEAGAAPAPVDAPPASKESRLPSWVTGRGLAAAGAAAAIFVGGGGIGYAVGASGHDDGQLPDRFDRAGFRPGQGELPGGRLPGGGQGPDLQQRPGDQFPGQPPGQSSGQSSDDSGSGSDSDTTTS